MMGVPTQGGTGTFAKEMLPRTCFVGEAERAWVAVPRRKLTEPLQTLRRFPVEELPEPPRGFVESLRCALRPQLSDGRFGIEAAAELAGTAVRTLQRRLRSHGRTYSGLIDATSSATRDLSR
jgi:hypothetical protein